MHMRKCDAMERMNRWNGYGVGSGVRYMVQEAV